MQPGTFPRFAGPFHICVHKYYTYLFLLLHFSATLTNIQFFISTSNKNTEEEQAHWKGSVMKFRSSLSCAPCKNRCFYVNEDCTGATYDSTPVPCGIDGWIDSKWHDYIIYFWEADVPSIFRHMPIYKSILQKHVKWKCLLCKITMYNEKTVLFSSPFCNKCI